MQKPLGVIGSACRYDHSRHYMLNHFSPNTCSNNVYTFVPLARCRLGYLGSLRRLEEKL